MKTIDANVVLRYLLADIPDFFIQSERLIIILEIDSQDRKKTLYYDTLKSCYFNKIFHAAAFSN